MKICKDCAFYIEPYSFFTASGDTKITVAYCSFLKGRTNPIDGEEIEHISAEIMRIGPCGWEGNLWKARAEVCEPNTLPT